MAREFFLVPIVGDGLTRATSRKPKYVDDAAVTGWGALRFSHVDDAILMLDATQTYLNSVAGQTDTTRICTEAQLDNNLSAAQRTAAQNALEARSIPAQWITNPITFRQVIRTAGHIGFVNLRLGGTFAKSFHDRIHTWLANGGLRNVSGFEDQPIPTTPEEFGAQGKILLGLTYSQLPNGVQNYLLEIRDRQGWTNQELGLNASSTVKQILRAMGNQGVGIRRRLQRHGLTLGSTWSELPQGFRDELQEIVQDFGLDPVALGLSGTSTLRQILKTFADQFASLPVIIGGVSV